MKETIYVSILQALEKCTSIEGVNLLSRFTPLDIGYFAEVIHSYLPSYSDELVDVIINNFLIFLEDEEKLEFVHTSIMQLLNNYIKRKHSPELFSLLSFWFNVLNKLKYNTNLNKREENVKDYLLSHIIPNLDELNKEIKTNPETGTTKSVGGKYLRVNYKEFKTVLIPSTKTVEDDSFKKLLNINQNKDDNRN